MNKICILLASGLLALVASAREIVIDKEVDGKISINLGGFQVDGAEASRTFLSVLKADLNRSGYFTVSSSGGSLNTVGRCAAQGAQVQVKCQIFNSATRAGVFGRSYSGTAENIRRLAHTVADDIVLAVTGKPGMASARLALVSSRTGRKELYICDVDGGNLRQLTNDRSIVVGPRWAPDGQRVTYTSYKLGYPNVFVTGKGRPLSSHGGLNASGAISPDGKSMALILSKDGNPEMYVKSLRTGRLTRLTNTRRGNEASPCWSPDGNHIAFVSDTTGRPQVYVISKNGGRAQRVTTSGSENVAPD